MLALLNRIVVMIQADTYLSNTDRLGKSEGGVKVYGSYPSPRPDYPCLILNCRANMRPTEEVPAVTLMGWLLTTKAEAPNGQVQTQLDAIYLDHSSDPHEGLRPLLHDNAVGIGDPATGLSVWMMEETFKANSLMFSEKTGEYSMHFQFSGLVGLD